MGRGGALGAPTTGSELPACTFETLTPSRNIYPPKLRCHSAAARTRSFAAMATATAMKGLVGAAQANVRAEEESMDPVKLIASDGTEVILDRRAAMVSGTIKAMLAGPGASAAPSLLLAAV